MAVDQSPYYPCIGTAVCTRRNGVIQDTRPLSELQIAPPTQYTLTRRVGLLLINVFHPRQVNEYWL